MEQANIEINEMIELNANILKETGGATSLAFPGLTRDDAATTLMKLSFPCQGADCGYSLMMNLLIPTFVKDNRKDLCFACFKSHMKVNWSNKAFRLQIPEAKRIFG